MSEDYLNNQNDRARADAELVTAEPKKRAPRKAHRTARRNSALGLNSVEDVKRILESTFRDEEGTSVAEVVARADESGVAYVMGADGELAGVVLSVPEYSSLLKAADNGD
jgi:hypothetical protein